MKNLYAWFICIITLLSTQQFAHAQTITAGTVTGTIIACSGTVSANPNLQQFTVSGIGLTSNIIVTAPTNFEVSTNAVTGYASSITLTQTSGTVASTIIYIRSTVKAAAGAILGNITLASTGATTVLVAATGTVNAIPTVNPIGDKTFNSGIASTTISFTGAAPSTMYNWVNNNPSIGLAASGSGDITSFTAINASCTPVIATVTVTPSAAGCTGSVQTFTITINPLPILGTYTNNTLTAGQNINFTPTAAPINATSLVANTNTNFTGILLANPITGVVTVTNAKPAGVYNITLKATSSNGCTTTTSSFLLTITNPVCGQSLFVIKPPINTTSSLSGYSTVAVGDFNGDGKQDIASAGGNVSIRLGNGDGNFGDSTQINVGFSPTAIAIGDFNGDGKQDFAAGNIGGYVSIRLGDGLGGFSGKPDISVNGGATSIAIGDFNGDGKQDIIVAARESPTTINVCLGDGTGGFSSKTVGVSPHSTFIAIGDFNNDGKQDFVTTGSGGSSVGLGDGTGSFSVTALGNSPTFSGIAIGDFNGDGKQDIALAGSGANTIATRLGDGLGGFGAPIASAGTNAVSLAVGDFNGDGKQDIATVSNNNPITVTIRLGDGAGGFSSITNTIVGNGNSISSLAIGDFNGDGKQDIIVTTTNLTGNYSSYIFSLLGGANEINVKGNSVSIASGDNSPSLTDSTNFGSICSNDGTIVKTFTIENTGATALQLNSSAIAITGIDAGLFTVGSIVLPTSIAGGSSATFTITFTPSSVTGTKTATVHIANNNCDKADYNFAITATVNALPQGVLIGNPACIADAGQFTFTASSGTAPYNLTIGGNNYSNVRSGAPFNALPNPTSTTNYAFTSAIDSNGCSSNFTNVAATITKYGDTLAFNNDVGDENVQGANAMLLANGSSCRTLATILPNNTDPNQITGSFTAKVWVETTQTAGYVKRHYQITPATNAGTATATLTLYFTQQEFTDFNAVNSKKLPIDGTDAANNKVNLLIEKRSGFSSDGSGLPNTYLTGNPINITPTSVSWNATASRWEVTFPVTGFSGFFAKTQATVLPVTLLSFTANFTANKTTSLQWNVAEQVKIKIYVVEKSTDGNSFNTIGSVAANSLAATSYNFTDISLPSITTVFYRLKIVGVDGTTNYSQIVSVKLTGSNTITVYPNPAKNFIWLQGDDESLIGTDALIADMQGRIISKTRISTWPMQINVSGISDGVYFIQLDGNKFLKVVIGR